MIILDTNVISELMRSKPFSAVASWVAKHSATELATTSITEAEILFGIEILEKSKRRDGLLTATEAMFGEDFAGRVFGFDSEAARVFSRIAAHRSTLGSPISHGDAQIASIAKARGAKLATRNIADFAECGLDVVDP
jgi:predicted nucleic acid-binding protein